MTFLPPFFFSLGDRLWPRGGFLVLLALLAGGCSANQGRVEGIIALDGQPVAGAEVAFHPDGDTKRNTYSGKTNDEGRYELLFPQGTDGVAPGSYRVVVTKHVAKPGAAEANPHQDIRMLRTGGLTENVLPSLYSTPEKTPLRAEVNLGKNTFNFQLTSGAGEE
jgi:hypothetical protein